MFSLLDSISTVLTSSAKTAAKAAVLSSSRRRTVIETGGQLRVEPMCLVSSDISELEDISKVKQLVTGLYASFHMIAVSSMSLDVNNADIVKILDNLSPSKSAESFIRTMEDQNDFMYDDDAYLDGLPCTRPVNTTEDVTFNASSVFKDHPTGIVVDVNVTIGEVKNTLPLIYMLRSKTLDPDHVADVMAHKPLDSSMTEKLYKHNNRGTGYIEDLLVGKALIDRQQRMMMRDHEGSYAEAVDQVRRGHLLSILGKSFNPVTASSIYIVSAAVAKKAEKELGGPISNAKIRARVFDNSLAMMIVVVDYEWDRVVVWYSGINAPTTLTLSKVGKKTGDMNIMDLFKTLKGGNAAIL